MTWSSQRHILYNVTVVRIDHVDEGRVAHSIESAVDTVESRIHADRCRIVDMNIDWTLLNTTSMFVCPNTIPTAAHDRERTNHTPGEYIHNDVFYWLNMSAPCPSPTNQRRFCRPESVSVSF